MPPRSCYAFANETYFSVIYHSQGQKIPILALIGITPNGPREMIDFTTGEHENQSHVEYH